MVNRKELMNKYKDEKVFIIPFSYVENIDNGFCAEKHSHSIWTKYDSIGKYVFRYDAEYEPSMQQLIPYILIANNDQSKFYVGTRTGGDNRLVNYYQLGFGGHINEIDGYDQVILKALSRELNEELDIDILSPARFIGTLRNDKSETNDHFGLAFIIIADEQSISVKEKDKMIGQWMPIEEVFDNINKFEDWSRYIINYLYDKQNNK